MHFLTLGLLLACAPFNGRADGSEGVPPFRGTSSGERSQERLPQRGEAWVIFGSDTVRAEVARTADEREEGLMYRESLEEGRGMLFVFQDSQVRSFWMKNTLIPLDVAYLDENLTVVDIQGMDAETEDAHTSARPAMFALEVPLGWFEKMGITVSDRAKIVFGPG